MTFALAAAKEALVTNIGYVCPSRNLKVAGDPEVANSAPFASLSPVNIAYVPAVVAATVKPANEPVIDCPCINVLAVAFAGIFAI
jgi:hypothetical protein